MTRGARLLIQALAVLALAGAARADTLTLDNGRRLRGRIVRRSGGQVVIQLENGGRITVAANRVVMVEPDAKARPRLPRLPVGAEEKPKPKPGVEKPGKPPEKSGRETKPAAPEAEKPDPELTARIAALIGGMGASEGRDAQEQRTAARAALAAIGEPALPALCRALEDSSWQRRLSAAIALGQIGSKEAVKPLLVAVYTGTPAAGKKAAWWEKQYLNECARSFGRIAGSSYGYDADKVTAGKAAEKMLEWWGKNHEDYPLQIGDKPPKPKKEGEKEEEKPDPVEEIKKLPARRYPKPPSRVHDR